MTRPASVVLVTGATSGLGAAIADRFAADGARIIGVGRRRERLEEMRRKWGERFLPVVLDVTDAAAVQAMVASLPEPFREVTVLVNSAGVALGTQRAPDAAIADWQRMVQTNISGVVTMTHAVLPGMAARDYGDILNIGSITGSRPYPTGNVYGATKAFIHQFTQNLHADLLGRNIRAMCIEPGTVRTEFALVRTGSSQEAERFYRQPNLMEPQDVAEIAHFCVSMPRRVNITAIQAVPICQSFGGIDFAEDMAKVDPGTPDR